jgi:hypothetical protein
MIKTNSRQLAMPPQVDEQSDNDDSVAEVQVVEVDTIRIDDSFSDKNKSLLPDRSKLKSNIARFANSINSETCLKDSNGNDITIIAKNEHGKTMDNRERHSVKPVYTSKKKVQISVKGTSFSP